MLWCRHFSVLLYIFSTLAAVISLEIEQEWLVRLSSAHSYSTDDASELNWYQHLTELYAKNSDGVVEYKKLTNDKYAADTANNITDRIFRPRRAYLEKTVKAAEDIAVKYDWSKMLDIEDVNCCDATNFTYNAEEQDERKSRFPKPVNFTYSTVHTPTEVYEGELATMRGLDWTSALDDLWIQNENEARVSEFQEDLLWQYFGSEEGFVRNYPGSKWPEMEVDLYDARTRSWYNQGAGSPKDVLILIDTSGSTVGQTLYLMQLTVQKLLDTLGEDDYIQIANFSDTERMNTSRARLGPECFPNFVQATTFNKALLMSYVNKLDKPQGQANFEVALKYAYETFEQFDEMKLQENTGAGANCSKIIIILTDGGIERPEGIIYNHDKDKKYRIFTFAMGLTPTPLDAVKWLACENRGYFAYINNIGSISRGIREFTHVLSRPLEAKAQESLVPSMIKWTYPDPLLGLGMLTTLTMPVFNKTDMNNITLLGVMAADVAINEFDQFVKFRELGPLGYTFIINHNGFVVRHPVLRAGDLWDLEPPSIDFLDAETVEKESALENIEKVRTKMIDKMKYDTAIKNVGAVLLNENNPAYFLPYTANYHVVDVKETAYRLGVVHPIFINHAIEIQGNFSTSVLRDLVDQKYTVTAARWGLCERIYHLNNDSVVLDQLTWLIDNETIKCEMSMVKHLLWDAYMVNKSKLHELVDNGTVEAITYTSAGGLSVMYPMDPTVSPFRFKTNYRTSGSKKAFAMRNAFIYTAPYSKRIVDIEANTTGPSLTVYKAVNNNASDPYVFGVMSVTINSTYLTQQLVSIESTSGEQICNASSRCFLVDDGGFVIAEGESAHPEGKTNIGRWLGDADKSLMYTLFNEKEDNSVFLRHKNYDYQQTCIGSWRESSSSGNSFRIPTLGRIAEMAVTQWTTTSALLYNSWWSFFNTFDSAEAIRPLQFGEKRTICTKVGYQYYFNENFTQKPLSFKKNACERKAETKRIENTNLLLVVANIPDATCEGLIPLPQAPVEMPAEEYDQKDSMICKRWKRKRDRPTVCYNTDKEGFPYTCGACRQAKLSVVIVALAFLIYVKIL